MSDKTLAPWDKVLPNQPFNSNLFNGAVPFERAIYETILRASNIKPPQQEFSLERSELFTIEEMASSPITLQLLRWLIRIIGAKRVLEIGCFIGVSALYFAKGLPPDGKVVTVEKFDRFAEIALRNFSANGLAHKIDLHCGDAGTIVPILDPAQPFDLIFIDGNKERYAFYLSAVTPLVRAGGIVVVDDAFFHGDALNDRPHSDKGQGVRACLDLAASQACWDCVLLPISNGIMLLTKQAS